MPSHRALDLYRCTVELSMAPSLVIRKGPTLVHKTFLLNNPRHASSDVIIAKVSARIIGRTDERFIKCVFCWEREIFTNPLPTLTKVALVGKSDSLLGFKADFIIGAEADSK